MMVCSLAGGTWLPVTSMAMRVLWMSMAVDTLIFLRLQGQVEQVGRGVLAGKGVPFWHGMTWCRCGWILAAY